MLLFAVSFNEHYAWQTRIKSFVIACCACGAFFVRDNCRAALENFNYVQRHVSTRHNGEHISKSHKEIYKHIETH